MDNATILLVDDTESNIDILLEMLSDYDLLVATDGPGALEIVQEEQVDLVLLDIMMPEMDGFEVCRRMKGNPQASTIPVVFITAKTDEDSIEQAYEVGGLDYVTKPFKQKELLARVSTQLRIKSLIENLEFLSSCDTMTGLYNRRKFFELAELKFKHQQEDLHAVMIDIDHFKKVNDTYGHATGDRVIKALASVLQECIDDETVLGRLGGEEFAIVCNKADKRMLEERIEGLRMKVAAMVVKSDDGEIVNFTISSGIAKMNDGFPTIDHLLKSADDALYEAKGLGRNRAVFRVFSDPHNDQTV